jgi:hypothetical protein
MKLCVACIVAVLAATSIAAKAETFFLKRGEVVEGEVVRALGDALTIKLADAGMRQVPLSSIERMEMTASDGSAVSGSLAWWAGGVYVLVTDQGLVEVKDGVIRKVAEEDSAPPGESSSEIEAPTPAVESLGETGRATPKPTM